MNSFERKLSAAGRLLVLGNCLKKIESILSMFNPQVRLANVGGDVLAVGGMALDLLDSVEQVPDKGFVN